MHLHVSFLEAFLEAKNDYRIGAARMVMSNLTMACLTTISLGTDVGFRTTTLTPSHTRAFYTRVLRRQGDSIRFIANHCTRLVSLKYSPNLVALEVCKQHSLIKVANVFKDVVEKCEGLERLEIEAFQHYRRCGCSEASARPGIEEIIVNESMTKDGLPEGKWSGVEQWAKSALLKIRKRDDLLVKCPIGPLSRPGEWHGHWW